MNVPDYLKELLLQYNEVSVPGLGAFSMVRKNATYNEKEGKFYPPFHQVKFNPQSKDDNLFVKYIASKKNILLETAVYIVEKFVSELLEQANRGSAEFADIGWFSKENHELAFKPNDKLIIDPSFYGYSPITLDKLSAEKPKPVFVSPAPPPSAAEVQSLQERSYLEKTGRSKKPLNGLIIIFGTFVFSSIILFCAYWIFPTFAIRLKTAYQAIAHNKTDDTVVLKKKLIPIREKRISKVNDSASALLPNAAKSHDFEVVVDLAKTLPEARAEVRRLEAQGIDAEILTNVPGMYLNVSIGSFPTYAEADSVLQLMLRAKKINKKSHIRIL